MVYILLGEGFEEAEAIVPGDLLRRAGVEVAYVGLEGLTVTGSHCIPVTADMTLEQVKENDMEILVLPGGRGGVASIQMDLFATALIQKARDKGCWLAAICAAPSILAHMGMLDGRKATCHPCVWEDMGSAAVDRQAQVVVDGPFITGQAAGAAYPFGLKLVEILKGAEAARTVADAILYRG